jgi:membrane protease YdiL (CAAX protease family)
VERESIIWKIHAALKDLGKLLLYLLVSIALGALLAPAIFHGGQWLAAHGIFAGLETQPFRRFFNRSVQLVAIVLLWPLAKSLRVETIAELGLRPDRRWWRRLSVGLAAAVLLMLVMCVCINVSGDLSILPSKSWKIGQLPKALFAAACVGVIEECVFRGAFLGLFHRSMGRYWALFFSSAFFSVLHFIKPVTATIAPGKVGWLSGFELLGGVLSQWAEPAMVGAMLTTLFAVGWVLGWATQRSQSLWMSIGLHTGWVLCVKGLGIFARLGDGGLPWIGRELRIGIAPLITVLFTGAVCWLWLTYGDRSRSDEAV